MSCSVTSSRSTSSGSLRACFLRGSEKFVEQGFHFLVVLDLSSDAWDLGAGDAFGVFGACHAGALGRRRTVGVPGPDVVGAGFVFPSTGVAAGEV